MKRKSRARRGAVLVEFVLVMTLLIFMMFGIMEMGYMMSNSLTVSNAAAEGARAAALQQGSQIYPAAQQAASSLRKGDDGNPDITVTTEYRSPDGDWTDWDPRNAPPDGTNDQVRVTVSYDYKYITGSMLGRLLGSASPTERTITSSSVTRW